ncbi:MAG TPA: hypothetical protein VM367_12805 [Pseudonocardia sp.]|nr:hypothetical protein [Pseudonocardia sp.]
MHPRPDGPSLLRPTDRARQVIRRAEILLGAVAVLLAVLVGSAVHASELERARAGSALGPVPAVLLEASPFPAQAHVMGAPVPVAARWTAPDGTPRTGRLWAEPGLPAGATVPVWVDGHGLRADAPLSPAMARLGGWLAGIGTAVGCGILLLGLAGLARRVLDVADDRRWSAEWARIEPRWSGRVPP